jgi:short-subunit dehydrogenase
MFHKNKKIWIIGASTGIGAALAKELHSQGVKLILSARNKDKLDELNAKLGGEHYVIAVDAGNANSLKNAARTIDMIDSVVFLAAIYSPHSDALKPIEFVHDMINVNLGGAFNTVYAVQDIFEKQGHGHIALCGSVAGFRGLPNGQPYCATKAAIINYAESLKIEMEIKNIKVQVINPGFVKSPLTDKNEFDMPMIMETEDAAKALAKGLTSNDFEIHFPKRFTFIMKCIRALPTWLYFIVARQIRDKQ